MKKVILIALLFIALKAHSQGGSTYTLAHKPINLGWADNSGTVNVRGQLTITGNLYLPFNRWFGYNNTSPLAPIHVGNRNVLNSSNAQILVAGTYDDSFPLSGHAFSDGTLITGITGSKAYAGYDGRVDVQGSGVAMDHYVSFQHGPTYNFTGTVTDNFGLYTTSLFSLGTVTNNYGAYLANPIKTSGVLTNNYGLYIADQTSGSNNWSIYSAGGFNYFGGSMQIEGTLSLNSAGQNVRFKGGGTGATDAGIYVNASGNAFFADWNGTRGFVTLGDGNGYYFGGNFGVKTATPEYDLDVSGNGRFTGPVKVDVPTDDSHAVNRGYADTTYAPIGSSSTSGTYTPTATGITGIASVTVGTFHYIRTGNQVQVTGYVNPTNTTGGSSVISLTLPVGSTFAAVGDCSGTGSSNNVNTTNVRVYTIATDTVAYIGFEDSTTSSSSTVYVSFMYTVI